MSPYVSTAAMVISFALAFIGISKWSARRITDFADTEVQA